METKRKLLMTLGIAALVLLIAALPADRLTNPNIGPVLRWCGLILGILYFILRARFYKKYSKQ